MNKILIIGWHEFLTTITRKGYIIAVIGMPVFFTFIGGIGFLTGHSMEKKSGKSDAIALVDRAKLVDLSLAHTVNQSATPSLVPLPDGRKERAFRFVAYHDLDSALKDLKLERLAACYVIAADYLETGEVAAYTPESGFLSDLISPGRNQLYNLIRASLVKDRISGALFARVIEPASIREMKVSKQGEVKEERGKFQQMARFFGPFTMFLLLTMSIFFSSGYLLQGAAEEKQNRVIEVLLSSVKPTQLLGGKIIGLGAAGLLQVSLYLTFLLVPAMTLFAFVEFTLSKILLSLLYFTLGYLLFASLMAGTGVLGNSAQESGQLSAVWTLTSMIPMFLFAPLSQDPNSLLAKVFSFFPLTAPVTMLLRLSFSSKVPFMDVLISSAMLVIAIYLSIKGAAKILRTASLMHGKRPGPKEILRWLREN